MRKRGGKTEDSIDEKLPKLNEEMRKKTDHLSLIYCCSAEDEKLPKTLARKTVKKNYVLIV